eukprot:2415638-Amphidinium_carterae.1
MLVYAGGVPNEFGQSVQAGKTHAHSLGHYYPDWLFAGFATLALASPGSLCGVSGESTPTCVAKGDSMQQGPALCLLGTDLGQPQHEVRRADPDN